MKFRPTSLPGVWLIEPIPNVDQRGSFSRTYCENKFREHELVTHWPQCNVSFTKQRGTIRGMHFQVAPHPEIKLVRCVTGAIFDAVVDLRTGSPTFGKWEAFELSADNNLALYVPEGLAHGFQTLKPDSRVFYQMSEYYYPKLTRGIHWNDPAVGIQWPLPPAALSKGDERLPFLNQLQLMCGLVSAHLPPVELFA